MNRNTAKSSTRLVLAMVLGVVAVSGVFAAPSDAGSRHSLSRRIYFYPELSDPIGSQSPVTIRPRILFPTSFGTTVLKHLRWSGWGSKVAHATGILSYCNPNCATGKRTHRPARFRVSSPGRVFGHRVYRCYRLTVSAHPKSTLRACLGPLGSEYGYVPGSTRPVPPPAPAHAYIYWTQGQGNGAPIVRANLGGTGVRRHFINNAGSFGIALHAGHIYFTGDYSHPDTIGRANRSGTGLDRAFITTRTGTDDRALAVDGAHVYWSDQIGSTPTIGRANLDGTSVDPRFLTLPAAAFAIAVDGAHIYWSGPHAIGRANLDGSAVNQNFLPASNTPDAIAVDSAHIYWTNFGPQIGLPGTIGRANLDGTAVQQSFIKGAVSPIGLAIYHAHIYWANYNGTIGRAKLDGSSVDQKFMTADANDIAIAATG